MAQTASVRRPFPLPADSAADRVRALSRASTAAVLAEVRNTRDRGIKILTDAWPNDGHAHQILTRAATVPATTTNATWAGEFAVSTTANAFLSTLPNSAASALFSRALSISLAGSASVRVPFAAATPSLAPSIIAEGAPIPARQGGLATVTLSPRKLAVLTTLTNEINDHSTPVAETIIRQMLIATARIALDQTVFSTASGGLLAPPVVPITAATGGGLNAFLGDVKALTAAITTGGKIVLFMAPALMAAAAIYAPGLGIGVEIVPAPTLGTTVVAVDPAGVVSGAGSDEPRIDVGRETLVHQEDTTPLHISTPGSPNTVAAPVRSMWQTDSFALRLVLEFAFGARPGAVAFVPAVTW